MEKSIELLEPLSNSLELIELLPHRYPALYIQSVIDIDISGHEADNGEPATKPHILAVGSVPLSECAGHFPGHPVVKAGDVFDALGQAAAILALRRERLSGVAVVFRKISVDDLRQPLMPNLPFAIAVKVLDIQRKLRGLRYFFEGRICCDEFEYPIMEATFSGVAISRELLTAKLSAK